MTPSDYMEKVWRALPSARLLREGKDREGACNRAYYAMFDAAHAALMCSGARVNLAETKTHSGLIGAFGRNLVKTGSLPAERALNEVERVRLLADYTGDQIDRQKAGWAVDKAAAFLDVIQLTYALKGADGKFHIEAEPS